MYKRQPHSPVAIVTMFLISMSLVIFCLLFSFVDYVPVKGEIICYLSLTTWLISLSIMLSSFIHAVAKGRSSFFGSAVSNPETPVQKKLCTPMFIAEQFTVAKYWKQPKYPSVNE